MFRWPHVVFFLFVLILSACNDHEIPKTVPVKKEENVNEHVAELLKKKLQDLDSASVLVLEHDSLKATKQIVQLFSQFTYEPIFTNKGSLVPVGDSLLNVIKHAREYFGLYPQTYHLHQIDSLLKNVKDTSGTFDAVKLLKIELLLSNAMFNVAVHASKGRFDSDSLTPFWKISQIDTDIVKLFSNAIKKNTIVTALQSLEPKNEKYQQLKMFFADYLNEFKNEDWDSLPPIQQDTIKFYELLKPRLIASHDYDTSLKVRDEIKLMKAMKSFQKKHNLNDDGKMGKYTYQALCKTKEDHIRQIEMTLERWRWEPNKQDKRMIWVNIPAFTIKVYDKDTIFWQSKVITGSLTHHSPTLKSSVTYFIIYPYWNVPYKIASEEILPRIKWDTAYIRKNNFDILDWNNNLVDYYSVKWSKYNKKNLPYHFRQQEGGDNSLGVIKFMFNNKYGVYLHDTNGKRLFGKEVRCLSHGCIRLENPWVLASYLIKDDSLRYTPDSLFTYFEKEQKKTIPLRKAIPIYLKYFTCEVNKEEKPNYKGKQAKLDDKLFFYFDIYEQDKKMMKTVYK